MFASSLAHLHHQDTAATLLNWNLARHSPGHVRSPAVVGARASSTFGFQQQHRVSTFSDAGHVNSASHCYGLSRSSACPGPALQGSMHHSWRNNLQACLSNPIRNSMSDPIPLSAKISQNCFQLLTTTKLICIISSADRFGPRPFYLPLLHFANVPVISVLYFSLKKKVHAISEILK